MEYITIDKLRIAERIEKMDKEQMKNTETANAKNKRIQKALHRDLYGAHGIETVRKMNLSNLNDERGFLEWELDRMHREAKKNALLAEAENNIMDQGDKNTQKKKDFRQIGTIEDYERQALIEEAQAELLEDEKEKYKKQRLLDDFGRNFHGYISRPGQNSSQLTQTKIRKDFGKQNYYQTPKTQKSTNPRVKRLIDLEKLKQEDELSDLVKDFGRKENPQFTTPEMDPLLKSIQNSNIRQTTESGTELEFDFGRQAHWRPRSKRRQSRVSQLDHFNYINNLLPKINEQATMEVGHKDRRGIFVAEKDRDDLLSKLGVTSEDALNNYETIFAPDGHIRTTLTLQEDEVLDQIKDVDKTRYLKTDKKRFFEVELAPSQIFTDEKASQLIRDNSILFEESTTSRSSMRST